MSIFDTLAKRQVASAPSPPSKVTPMEQIENLGTKRNPLLVQDQLEEMEIDPPHSELNKEEWERILTLPIRTPAVDADIDPFSYKEIDARAYDAGFRLRLKQVDSLREFDQVGSALIQASVGAGKCAAIGTELYDTKSGKRRLVEELGGFSTVSMDETTGKFSFQPCVSVASGQKECVRVTLATGQEVTLSTDHPVFTDRGWVEASELTHDHYIAVPRSLPTPEIPIQLRPELVKFLAYMLADGCYAGNASNFTDDNPAVLAEFSKCVVDLGGAVVDEQSKSCGKATTLRINKLKPLLRSWGMSDTLSKEKRLPAALYGLSNEGIALLLNRFIACDGHLSLRSGGVEIILASKGLIEDLRHLFLRLGVISTSAYKLANIGEKKFDAWRLNVRGVENVAHLFSQIGLIYGQEEKTEELLASLATKGNTNIDVLPIGGDNRADLAEWFPHGKRKTVIELGITQGQQLGRKNFEKWVDKHEYTGKHSWLAYTDLLWTKIKSVEPVGTLPVFDLSVNNTHSWIANGVVVHNTLLAVTMAVRALKKGMKRALILVPAQVYSQLMVIDLPFLRAKFPISYPFVGLGGGTGERRKTLVHAAKDKTVFVLPYSLLSRGDPRALLQMINPNIVIADEAHYLKARDSARTKRFLDHMKANPDCKFVAMSGTLTSKSLADYHHLAVLALRDLAPVPKGVTQGSIWAGLLDATSVATAEKAKVLQPLRVWAKRERGLDTPYTIDGFREAYRARLESAPGCVLTRRADDLETSLIFESIETEVPKESKLHEHFKNLDGLWLAPTGDEISHAIHLYKWRYELSAGFYYALVWPEARNDEHQRMIDAAKEHHAMLQDYHKELRGFLSATSIPNLDTPMLVGAGIARGDKKVPAGLAALWHQVKALEFEGMPKRQQSPVRVDDYKIRVARDWAESTKGGGIIWAHHQEMVDWLCEEIPGTIPARAGDLAILKHKNRGHKFVASMSAHGTGKNLQHFQNQLFVQWCRPANEAEQVLGRLHRPGQEADEITAHLVMGMEFDHQLFCATLSDALYIHLTTGAEQKLLYGTYSKPPRIYEPRLLDKLGFQGDLKKLDPTKLKEKFSQ